VILVTIAALVLNLNRGARIWLAIYLALLACGFVASVLIYCSRQSYDRPKSGAIRFALAIFLFLNLYMGVLLVSAVRLGILLSGNALSSYAPYILPTSILGSTVVYLVARRSLEASRIDHPNSA
jgi:glucan phosphoethanolaminetransferase (alkaline phosphatase superfamily)